MNKLKLVECSRCRYFGTEGGPGPIMCCFHPSKKGYDGFCISWHEGKRMAAKADCPLEEE